MKSLIVEKTIVERGKPNVELYAVATSEPNKRTVTKSLTYEAYLTAWSANRAEVEALEREIEEVTP